MKYVSLLFVLVMAFASAGEAPVIFSGDPAPVTLSHSKDTLAPTTVPATTQLIAPPGNATTSSVQSPNGTLTTESSVTVPVAPAPWVAIVLGILGTIWTTILYPWILSQINAQKSAAALNAVDMTKSLLDQRSVIFQHLLVFLEEHALAVTQREFPILAQDILNGTYRDPSVIKNILASWETDIKNEAVVYFQSGGIDLLSVFGTTALDQLVSAAASRVSPFPGKDVATELLDDKVVPLLLNYGVNWVRSYYLGTQSPSEVATAKALDHLPAEKDFKPLTRAA